MMGGLNPVMIRPGVLITILLVLYDTSGDTEFVKLNTTRIHGDPVYGMFQPSYQPVSSEQILGGHLTERLMAAFSPVRDLLEDIGPILQQNSNNSIEFGINEGKVKVSKSCMADLVEYSAALENGSMWALNSKLWRPSIRIPKLNH